MIKRLDSTPPLNLARTSRDPELLVDMEAFFTFSFWIAEELQDLICNHQQAEYQSQPKFTSSTDDFDAPYENWVEWE